MSSMGCETVQLLYNPYTSSAAPAVVTASVTTIQHQKSGGMYP